MKLLIIEDYLVDYKIITSALLDYGYNDYECENAASLADGLEKLRDEAYDIILCDLGLPDSSGLDTFELVNSVAPSTPIIVMSGLDDEETAVEAVKRGAQDYIVKGALNVGQIVRMIKYSVERKKAEKEILYREKLMKSLSICLNKLLTIDDSVEAIEKVLETVCIAFDADRAYVFSNYVEKSTNRPFSSQILEWTTDEALRRIDDPAMLKFDYEKGFDRWKAEFEKGEVICGDVENFPESEREFLEKQSIISLLVAPIMIRSEFWGFVGLDDCKNSREWRETEISVGKAAAAGIGSFIERKRAEEALVESEKKYRETSATKDRFFSIISHDLRNPLGAFKTAFEMLEKKYSSLPLNEVKTFIDDMSLSAKQLFELLEELLQWARFQRGKIPFNPFPVKLAFVVGNTAAMLEKKAVEKNIEIQYSVATDLIAVADINMLNSIVKNLLTNAIKFSHPGGRVEISAKASNEQIEISVVDSGVGIADHDVEKLFRLDGKIVSVGTAGEKGAGLGLIISKDFVEKNGGTIWAESQLGKGSTFSFTLPAAPAGE